MLKMITRLIVMAVVAMVMLVAANAGVPEIFFTAKFYPQNGDETIIQIYDSRESTRVKFTCPEDPKKEGYIFSGWYRNGKLWDFDTEVYIDFYYFFAEWLPDPDYTQPEESTTETETATETTSPQTDETTVAGTIEQNPVMGVEDKSTPVLIFFAVSLISAVVLMKKRGVL
jgi:hypothetical protein